MAGAFWSGTAAGRHAGDAGRAISRRPFIFRTLGKTGLKLPVISMGIMNADNPSLVEAALDAGIVHLDTAWIYQRGRNEEMVGNVVKRRSRESLVIATKIFMDQDQRGEFAYGNESLFLDRFQASLKRLQMDYVDILYVHNISNPKALTFKPYLDAMIRMKKEGRARFLGISTHQNEPAVIRAAVECGHYDVVLTAYNYRQQHHEDVASAIAFAAGRGMGIVGMKAIAGFVQNIGGDHRAINAKAALKWALQNENIHTCIPGMTTFEHLETNLSIMENLTLTAGEKKELQIARQSEGVYCAQCRTCLPQCPAGFDIPTAMRSYMYAYGYGDGRLARDAMAQAGLVKIPCGECHACPVQCNSGFDVRTKALRLRRLAEASAS